MKLVTAEQMRRIDHEAIVNRSIPGPELMENAGRGIARRIKEEILSEPRGRKVVIFCGKGNNGGDGFVAGRYLHQYGATVEIYFPAPVEGLSDDAGLNYKKAGQLPLKIMPVESAGQLPEVIEADCILDAVFGTGFAGAPRGILADFIKCINRQKAHIVSVDCPSGLNVDTGRHEGDVVTADDTFTLALPKIGLYFSPGRELSGNVDIISIGIPDDIIDSFALKENLITPELVSSLLPLRKPDAHKGYYGRLFIVAGSTGLTGAATLAAISAARSGLGLVTVGCPESLNAILEVKLTEAMTYPLPDVAKKGVLAKRGLGRIRQKLAESNAAVIGPGLGRHHETQELVRRLTASLDRPAIIDADGLNAFEKDRSALEGSHAGLVLTPHPGEFKRLIAEKNIPEDLPAKFDLIRGCAARYDAVIVYKGSPTIVIDTDGQLYLNPVGNDGMATGGTGDVLSGIIGSLLAQGLNPLNSAVCGVYIHGLAGDLAAAEYGRRSMIAGDLIEFLPDAFELLKADVSG
jgi:hydroxyethylthiazole kinase-like uncharacterized protein yjeF